MMKQSLQFKCPNLDKLKTRHHYKDWPQVCQRGSWGLESSMLTFKKQEGHGCNLYLQMNELAQATCTSAAPKDFAFHLLDDKTPCLSIIVFLKILVLFLSQEIKCLKLNSVSITNILWVVKVKSETLISKVLELKTFS